jgi:hypothetical protein
MSYSERSKQVVVYLVKRHPLENSDDGMLFSWLQFDNDFSQQLEEIIGPFDPQKLRMLVDDQPAGEAWDTLLEDLLQERVHYLVTHLAPLSSAQRQQLIGVCAEVGTQLITPSDAGRNRKHEPDQAPDQHPSI